MNRITGIVTIAILFAACNGNTPAHESWPDDLEGKKSFLDEKRKELHQIEKDIERLESEIAELRPADSRAGRLVTVDTVATGDFNHYVSIQGTVQSDDMVNVTTEVPGRIVSLPVKEGQNIRSGTLIAKVNLEQIDKQIAELEKSLELASEVYRRQKRLWDQNIGSEIQYLEAKNNMERLEKSLETIRVQQAKGNIYAPISGVIERVNLKAGELASPGVPIITILNTDRVKVVAEVPESYLTAIDKGDRVSIEIPALKKEITARVTLIGKTIHPSNRTFDVEVDLRNPTGMLKPNLLAIMKIRDYSKENAVTVPLELIQHESNGKAYVFLKENTEMGAKAKKVYVKTGKSYEGEIVVEEGLKGGENIIVTGARTVSDNEKINIQNKRG